MTKTNANSNVAQTEDPTVGNGAESAVTSETSDRGERDQGAGTVSPEARRPTVTPNAKKPKNAPETKADAVLKRLRSAKGATVASLMDATGWQAHSVRGFLSGTVRKKLGLNLISETGRDGQRRYRIESSTSVSA